MSAWLTARQLLTRDYLDVRARLLDIAASLDRIDRGADAEQARDEAKYRQLQDGLRLLCDGRPDRTTRVQMLFSMAYDPAWHGSAGGVPPQ